MKELKALQLKPKALTTLVLMMPILVQIIADSIQVKLAAALVQIFIILAFVNDYYKLKEY